MSLPCPCHIHEVSISDFQAYTLDESAWSLRFDMFDEISEPRTTKRKRQEILLSVMYIGLGILFLAKGYYTRNSSEIFLGLVWIFGGLVRAWRSGEIDEAPITQLRINQLAEPKNQGH